MMRGLLVRGMIAGVLAGLAAAAFAFVFGEPALAGGIAHEHHAAPAAGETPGVEQVGRAIQSTLGLGVALVVYGAALGGIFALAYAFAQRRLGPRTPRAMAAVLAIAAFVVVFVVPFLKYPASPPGSSDPSTISQRTGLYLVMVLMSISLALAATALGRLLSPKLGSWNATLAAVGAYIVAVGLVAALLPAINEMPADFPATVLYEFRLAALGAQAVLWSVLGLVFGALVDASERRLLSTQQR
jgi:Probable cobalt transporter subunit (CbtA)